MKRNFKTRAQDSLYFARDHALFIGLGLPALLLLIYFLSHIPVRAAIVEQDTAHAADGLRVILNNPINAPFKILVFFTTLISSSILAVRAISILFFFSTCTALFYTLRHWHSKHAAGLATVSFATNAVVLSVARLGTPLVTVWGWFMFTSLLLWQIHGRSNKFIPGITLLAVASLLYTPGAPWFFGVFLFFYWSRFKSAFNGVKTSSIFVSVGLGLIVLTPLIYGFIKNPSSAIEWLLLPDTFDPKSLITSLAQVPSAYIYKMPNSPLINVSSLPVFDLACGFLFLIGLNAYRQKIQLDRTRLMLALALVGCIIGAFGQVVVATIILLPFAFSMIAAGIEYLLDEWKSVFPKNPFARSFGVTVIAAVVLFGMYYQMTRFLVVWPQRLETREIYDQSRIIENN